MSKYCHVINLHLESLWVMRVVIRADCREIVGKRLMERTMDGKEPGPVFSFVSYGRMPCLRVHHTKILIKNSLTSSLEAAQSPEDWLIYTWPWVQSPATPQTRCGGTHLPAFERRKQEDPWFKVILWLFGEFKVNLGSLKPCLKNKHLPFFYVSFN